MTQIYKEVRAVLETELNSVFGGFIPIAYENVDYKPTTGSVFMKPQFQPTIREPAVRGTNPQQYLQGLFTVLVHSPENRGPGSGESTVTSILDNFDATTDLGTDPIVSISFARQESSYSDPPWFVTPITIGWYIYS